MGDYKTGILKTGFILEDKIVQELKQNGWSIINNKFYEDDLLNTVREMDILAYKVSPLDGVYIYTTLLISCKKSEENAWALLSRKINLEDPNSNCWPLHTWTNDTAVNACLEKKDINKSYYNYVYKTKKVSVMAPPEVDVFATQEMNKSSGKPKDDKNIFSSLTTLMKAQSYEIGALDSRKKEKCIYQFNLISVIDSDLVRLDITNDEIKEEEVETEQLVARYIIRKKEQFCRIRFLKADVFSKYVLSYNQLHSANFEFFKKERDLFYKDAVKSYDKVNLLKEEFANLIWKDIFFASRYNLDEETIKDQIQIVWYETESLLKIYVTGNEKICQYLNEDSELKESTKTYLYQVFRFEGSFIYDPDQLPF